MFDSADLQDLYQQVILDHGRNPRNFREQPEACRADGFNPLCGDQVTVYAALDDGTIEDVSFKGKGCAICTASASMMTQAVKGKTVDETEALFTEFHDLVTGQREEGGDVMATLGKLGVFAGVRKYPVRVKCASLPWHTLRAALSGGENVSTE